MKHISDSPIGIFDSGIGGLTVASAIRSKLPSERLIYLGDTARVPYGTKSARMIEKYALECCLFLLRHNVKLIVIACNTASALAQARLRDTLQVPIIGVIEPGVNAALKIKRDNIGVIGTPATIRSQAYKKTILSHSPSTKVTSKACPLFVPLTEEGEIDDEITRLTVSKYLSGLKRKKIGSLILGCTHYPLLKNVISDYLGNTVKLIDSAEETAREVRETLLRDGTLATHGNGGMTCYVTDLPRDFNRTSRRFFGGDSLRAIRVSLED